MRRSTFTIPHPTLPKHFRWHSEFLGLGSSSGFFKFGISVDLNKTIFCDRGSSLLSLFEFQKLGVANPIFLFCEGISCTIPKQGSNANYFALEALIYVDAGDTITPTDTPLRVKP